MEELTNLRTMSVESAAQRLGIGIASAYQGVRAGEIPSIRIGNRILVPCALFEALLRGDLHGKEQQADGVRQFHSESKPSGDGGHS